MAAIEDADDIVTSSSVHPWDVMLRRAQHHLGNVSSLPTDALQSLLWDFEHILSELKLLLSACLEPAVQQPRSRKGKRRKEKEDVVVGTQLVASALCLDCTRWRVKEEVSVEGLRSMMVRRMYMARVKSEVLSDDRENNASVDGDLDNEENNMLDEDNDDNRPSPSSSPPLLPPLQFTCSHCGKDFASKRWVQKHEPRCSGVHVRVPRWTRLASGDYACAVVGCKSNRTFPAMYGLRRHFYQDHVTEEERGLFKCDFCDERFPYRTLRNEHVRLKHLKRHQCDFCGMRFGEKEKLRCHQLVHTGEKPFSCEHCNYRAAKKYNLDVHKQTKHQDFGGRSFFCEICGRAFQTEATVKGHITSVHTTGSKKGTKENNDKRGSKKIKREAAATLSDGVTAAATTTPAGEAMAQNLQELDEIMAEHQGGIAKEELFINMDEESPQHTAAAAPCGDSLVQLMGFPQPSNPQQDHNTTGDILMSQLPSMTDWRRTPR